MSDLVLAAQRWPSNAELIAHVAELGHLKPGVLTLDPTFENGIFWKVWHPGEGWLITKHRPTDGSDFRCLPYGDGHFAQIAYDPPYCVDEETEILTQRGWLGHEEIQAGDLAYTLNMDSRLAEWVPVLGVTRLPAEPREMLRLGGRDHSSLSTLNHRWPVGHRLVASEDLGVDASIPVCARSADLPAEPKYSDAFVELVAWFWTEGHLEPGGTYGNIVQSHEVNDAYCARIRSALAAEFGPDHGPFPRLGRVTDGMPRWREAVDGHKAVFWLSSDLGALLAAQAPGRVPSFGFLLSLTAAQLELFVAVSLMADGHEHAGRQRLGQKDCAAAEAFGFACVLTGRAVSLRQREDGMWVVSIRRQTQFKPFRNHPRREIHDGLVWCPATRNQTWLARRRGTMYFTGNCPMGGVDTSTIFDYNARFGRDTIDGGAAACQVLINDGLTEMWRLVEPGGIVLVKCQDHVWNGDLWLGTHWTADWAIKLGFTIEEELRMYDIVAGAQPWLSTCANCGLDILRRDDHVTWSDRKRKLGGGPSNTCRLPDGTPGGVPHAPTLGADGQIVLNQDHAAYSCLSTLFVLRKPTGKRPKQYNFAALMPADPTKLPL